MDRQEGEETNDNRSEGYGWLIGMALLVAVIVVLAGLGWHL